MQQSAPDSLPSDSLLKHYESPTVFPAPARHASTACDALIQFLSEMGVEHGFGLVGGPIAPFSEALLHSPVQVVHCRHEGGAAFAATEAYFASGRPSLVFTTTGPGLLNALTGLAAARCEGAKVVVISATTSTAQRGRGAAQESSDYTLPTSGIYTQGPLFDYATQLEGIDSLQEVLARLAAGLARPQGFVAHIALPVSVQTQATPQALVMPAVSVHGYGVPRDTLETVVSKLSPHPFALWLGFGARHAVPLIRAFAERTGCAVMCSPRAKGIFPEEHPQFVGVTGLGGHVSVDAYMEQVKPRHTLVLGTRMGEGTSYWSTKLVPSGGFIQVDLDPTAFGAAYPSVKTWGVQADIQAFMHDLLETWPDAVPALAAPVQGPGHPELLTARAHGPVRPAWVMQGVQRVCIQESNAPVMAESGNTFTWANHLLRFSTPHRYRVSPGYGSMGHFVAGVLGAAMGRNDKAVALVGDGAMLMNNEVSTAVRYGARAVWVVMNDGQYGMVEQGMRALGFTPVETPIPPTDFAALARAQGAFGMRVESEDELEAALCDAMRLPGPVVVDVVIDASVASPLMRRIECLKAQGVRAPAAERAPQS